MSVFARWDNRNLVWVMAEENEKGENEMSEAKTKTPISQEKMAEVVKAVTAAQDACYELESVASGLAEEMIYVLDKYEWPEWAKENADATLSYIDELERSAEEVNRDSERALGALMDLNKSLPRVYDVLDTYSENELLEALVRKQAAREAEEKKGLVEDAKGRGQAIIDASKTEE